MGLILHGNPMAGMGLRMLDHVSDDGGSFPFPNRHDTMHLNVVRPKDVPKGPRVFNREPHEASLSLKTDDIELAKAAPLTSRIHVNGPPEKEFIQFTTPRKVYPDVNRPVDFSLTATDIPNCEPNVVKFKTPRSMNPLTPRYQLPSTKEEVVDPPPVRMHDGRPWNSMEFVGTWKPRILERNYCRDPNDTSDIDKKSSSQRRGCSTPRAACSLSTIERAGERILTSKCVTPRSTCPLDPVYTTSARTVHPYLQGELESSSLAAPRQTGFVPGSKPRVLHRDNGEPMTSLIRGDIPGAVPQRHKGHLPFSIYDPPEITPYTRFSGLDCSDIFGAQTGTRKAGTCL